MSFVPTRAQIDAAFSPALYGMMLGLPLYGVALAQAAFYYRTFPGDHKYWKILVGVLIALDSMHIFSLTEGVHDWFLVQRLTTVLPRGALVASFTTYIIETVVQCAYALRVWALSNKNRWLTGFVVAFACIQLAGGMGVSHGLAVAVSIDDVHSKTAKTYGAVQLVASVICDVAISAAMVFLLNKNRNGIKRTESIIDRLIIYSVNVGLVTSVIAILNLVFWQATPQNFNFVIFHYIISKLYINSFLVTLNSRVAYRKTTDDVIQMSDMSRSYQYQAKHTRLKETCPFFNQYLSINLATLRV
ncbi:hypothetical protein Hypma_013123 [Hypsizygus marmoreus]|uniref:DUF6534 domain-containing protein n=1 Tax=Hypsizygus marmoreus TaxID=39966 RepID=A0A369JKL9_HYPMA|nr:hypothetical protein Hypma_013123 [Hypsizygus marmoreus]